MFKALKIQNLKELGGLGMAKCSTLPKFQTLSVTVPKPFVVHVELDRPDKSNAMNRTMWREIGDCFNELSGNPDCRVIILSGAGPKMFTAGLDLNDVLNLHTELNEHKDIARKSGFLWKIIKGYQTSVTSIEKCHKPVIGAIHGACIGGGLNLICATDIRYCTSTAWFQNKEIDMGIAADVGTLQRMPKIMGSVSLVNELAYTCRVFPASEALESGFVSKLFDSKESMIEGALETAELIAKKSPVAVQGTKRNLIFSRDHTAEDGLEHIALYNMSMMQSEDFINSVSAYVSKENPPTFSKL